jgi:hypothetical protein
MPAVLPPTSERPVVLVTGAARRVGRVIAAEMARAGWSVALHHHRSSPDGALAEVRALGARAQAFAADLADEAACNALLPRVVDAMTRVDAVVNSAAVFDHDDVWSFGWAAMDAHWRANTAPAIVLARSLHAHLGERARHAPADGRAPRGCVVNLTDQKLWNPNPDYLSYTLSKAALEAATHLLARALAPRVRVVGVAPGVTLPTVGTMSDAQFDAAHAMTALGRSSTPEDIARAVRFLIESPAVTGHTLIVDGGQHLVAQPRDVAFLVDAPPSAPTPTPPKP